MSSGVFILPQPQRQSGDSPTDKGKRSLTFDLLVDLFLGRHTRILSDEDERDERDRGLEKTCHADR